MYKKIKNKNIRNSLIFARLVVMLVILMFFTDCQDPTKGCLDVKATNFDVTATKQCDNCCTYPKLIVRADFLYGTKKFNQDSFAIGKDSIKLLQVQFYLSDIQLVTNKGAIIKPTDSTSIYRERDTLRVLNNVALLAKTNGFDYTIGSFKESGQFTEMRVKVGLNDTIKTAVPSKMPSDSPLSTKADSMYLTSQKQYIFNKIVFVKGQRFQDTVSLFITEPKDLKIVKSLSFTEGFDVIIPLKINYLNLFSGISSISDLNTLKQQIVSNYVNAFYIQ